MRTFSRVWPLVVAITLMALIGAVNIYVLSGVRAYVNGESSWSKGQRDGIVALQGYARTHDPQDFERYHERIAVPLADQRARLALEQDPPDVDTARTAFIEGRVNPDDVSSLIVLYRLFGNTSLFAESVAAWRRADVLIARVDVLAQELRVVVNASPPDAARIDAIGNELVTVNRELGPLTDRFSDALGRAARKASLILHLVTAICAFVFLVIGIWLVHRLVGRSDAIEREREAARQELDIARTIQASILLRSPKVPKYEIAGGMVAAGQVGGDYYDVLSAPEGCWVAIGDVSGHGLNAGLIAMMTQSALSALVSHSPDAPPDELVEDVNHVLFDNVHGRLATTDFMTFVLLRCHASGKVEWAGAHEALVVVRARDGRREIVDVIGTWLGVRASVRKSIGRGSLTLEPGDSIVLYSDGITEAMDAQRRMFGTDGIDRILADSPGCTPDEWVQRVLAGAKQWAVDVRDDMTVVAMRYMP